MQITLYHRTYPVKDAPVSLSLVPFATHQRHTFTAAGAVHEAECKEQTAADVGPLDRAGAELGGQAGDG